MKTKNLIRFAVVIAIFACFSGPLLGGACLTWSNAGLFSIDNEYYCGGDGGGCTMCVNNKAEVCVTNGSSCTP